MARRLELSQPRLGFSLLSANRVLTLADVKYLPDIPTREGHEKDSGSRHPSDLLHPSKQRRCRSRSSTYNRPRPRSTFYSLVIRLRSSNTRSTSNPMQRCRIEVTANCCSALRRLRAKLSGFTILGRSYLYQPSEPRREIWQLSLMGDIYSKAQCVYVWLKDGTANTDRAIGFLLLRKSLTIARCSEQA